MKKLAKKQKGGTSKKSASKTGRYQPDAVQEMRYAINPYVPFAPRESKEELRKQDSIADSKEMMRLRKKLGYDKKSGGATSKYKSGGQGPANKIGKMVKISKKK